MGQSFLELFQVSKIECVQFFDDVDVQESQPLVDKNVELEHHLQTLEFEGVDQPEESDAEHAQRFLDQVDPERGEVEQDFQGVPLLHAVAPAVQREHRAEDHTPAQGHGLELDVGDVRVQATVPHLIAEQQHVYQQQQPCEQQHPAFLVRLLVELGVDSFV